MDSQERFEWVLEQAAVEPKLLKNYQETEIDIIGL